MLLRRIMLLLVMSLGVSGMVFYAMFGRPREAHASTSLAKQLSEKSRAGHDRAHKHSAVPTRRTPQRVSGSDLSQGDSRQSAQAVSENSPATVVPAANERPNTQTDAAVSTKTQAADDGEAQTAAATDVLPAVDENAQTATTDVQPAADGEGHTAAATDAQPAADEGQTAATTDAQSAADGAAQTTTTTTAGGATTTTTTEGESTTVGDATTTATTTEGETTTTVTDEPTATTVTVEQTTTSTDQQQSAAGDTQAYASAQSADEAAADTATNEEPAADELPATSPQLCYMLADYAALTVVPAANADVRSCTLWLVKEPSPTIEPLPSTPATPRFAMLRAADSLAYVQEYRLGVMTALAYARLHGYRLFLYVTPTAADGSTADKREPYAKNLAPKRNGCKLLFAYLDHENAPEEAIMYNDLDGYMNLTRTDRYKLDSIVDGVLATRPADDRATVSVIMQAELGATSGVMVLYRRGDLGRTLWDRVAALCAKGTCSRGPNFAQRGLYRTLLELINGTNGMDIAGDACLGHGIGSRCIKDLLHLEERSVAIKNWGELAFVSFDPSVPEVEQPVQLHTCHWHSPCITEREAIWHHVGQHFWDLHLDEPAMRLLDAETDFVALLRASGVTIKHELGEVRMRDVNHEAAALKALDPAKPTDPPKVVDVIPPHPHTHAAIAERRLQIAQARAREQTNQQ